MKRTMGGMITIVGLAMVLMMGNAGVCTAAGLLVAEGGFGGRLAIQEHTSELQSQEH